MQQDNPFSENDSLALIESMISRAKNQFSESGHLYLLWGWVILICSLLQFVLLKIVHYEKHYFVWFLTWLAAVYQIFYIVRKKKNRKVKTYTDEIVGFVWLSFIITMFLFGFIIAMGEGPGYYKVAYPGFLAVYGIPTFLSGVILRFRALITGGICCWLLSIVSTFIPYEYQLLTIGAAMVIAWIVPGYLLQAKFKNANP